MYCPKCGSPNEKTAKFCIRCGAQLLVRGQPAAKPASPSLPPGVDRERGSGPPKPAGPGRRGGIPTLLLILLVVLALIAAAEILLLLIGWPEKNRLPGEPTGVCSSATRVVTSTPVPTATMTSTPTPKILLPPAGEGMIAFVAHVQGTWQVFIIKPDGTDLRQLTSLVQPGAGDPAISPDGTTIAFVNDGKNIYTVRTDGSDLRVIYRDQVEAGWPSWSPDGKKIVSASRRNGSLDLFIVNRDGTDLVQVTSGPAKDQDPAFSPYGTQIAFSSNRSGKWEIHVLTLADGRVDQITHQGDPTGTGWPSWSPDGGSIAFESAGAGASRDIYTVNADGTELKNMTSNPAYDGAPAWSPDGRQIAFVSNRDGGLNVFIMQDDGSLVRRLSELWAWGPSWSMTAPAETSRP